MLVQIFVLLYVVGLITCPPVTERPTKPEAKPDPKPEDENAVDSLEYERYLREVVSVLESDPMFKKKLEESNISDIKSGEIAKHLDFVGHGIRSQLDEIKRREVERLRQVMRMKAHVQNGMRKLKPEVRLNPIDRDQVMGHIDHKNPESFEIDDLSKLIKKATVDLEEVDRKRREEFKKYEMEKEHLRRRQLEAMDEKQKHDAEKNFEEAKKKHQEHPKIHHPGNEEQLKEVWEESDGMDKKDFDPKTFFSLHDTNGDGVLDEAEIEALFQSELDKVYDPNAPEDDMMERYEEMNRMREHVMNEIDANKDKLISLDEFMKSAESKEFKKDEEWETLDKGGPVYTEEELAAFEKQYEELQRQEAAGHPLPKQPPHAQDHLGGNAQQRPGVNEMHQQPPQPPQPPNQQQQQQQRVGGQEPPAEPPLHHL